MQIKTLQRWINAPFSWIIIGELIMSLSSCTLLTENSCCWAQDPEPVEFWPQSWSAASPWSSLAKPDRMVPASQSQSTGLFKTARREGMLYYSATNAKMVVASFEYIKPALRSPHKRGLPRLVLVSFTCWWSSFPKALWYSHRLYSDIPKSSIQSVTWLSFR